MKQEQLEAFAGQVEEISREVGTFLLNERKNFDREKIEHKGRNNLVSYVDEQAEKRFVSALSELFPEAGFIAEEGTGTAVEDGYNWVIDPLDGTTNFIHNIPVFCTSVALVKDGVPVIGVIYDPTHDELFSAVDGNPATLNGEPIKVSAVSELSEMLMLTGFPYDAKGLLAANLMVIEELTKKSRGIRRLGSAALDLCYVACGRADGMYEYGLSAWDVAAGACIVRQAGGVVNDFENNHNPLFSQQLIAGSPAAFKELLPVVQTHFLNR